MSHSFLIPQTITEKLLSAGDGGDTTPAALCGIQGQSFASLPGRLKSPQPQQTGELRPKDAETKVGGNFILSQSPSPTF